MVVKNINTWEDFLPEFFDDFDEGSNRFRCNFVFRGVSDASWDLTTSLQRVCPGRLDLEHCVLRNFAKYASMELKFTNFWELVSIAQHHGLPTRLLDWSYSPFVALHFATEDFSHYDSDGAIWCVDIDAIRQYLPQQLSDKLREHSAFSFNMKILSSVVADFESFKQFGNNSFPIFFEPPSIDSRIVNQFGVFSVISESSLLMDKWLNDKPNVCKKLIILKDKKLKFRDNLDQMNMNERVIYPGLDGLCKWLTRHYTPIDNVNKVKR